MAAGASISTKARRTWSPRTIWSTARPTADFISITAERTRFATTSSPSVGTRKSSGQGSRITRAFSSTEISCSGIRGHSWPATGTSSMSASITTRTGTRRRVRSVSPIAPGTSGVKPAWTPTQRLPILISPTRPATISISQRNLRQRSRDFSHLTFRRWASVTIERFVHPAALPFILVEWKGSPRIDPARSERVPETLAPSAGDDG